MIEGQKTLLNRTVHSISYDDIHDEIVVQSNIGQAILTFRGAANGEEAPIRSIQGPKTQLRDPEKLAVDPIHDEIFVKNMSIDDEVLVFDRRAQGDVAPKRVLKGPDTQLGANVLAVDPANNLLIVGSRSGILIFDRTAAGNTKPKAVIGGPKSGLRGVGRIAVHPPTRRIVVTTGGGRNEDSADATGFAGVWSEDDNGDVPPQWTIAKGSLRQSRGLTLDPKNKTIIIADKYLNAVMTFSLPEMFERSDRQPQTARVDPRK